MTQLYCVKCGAFTQNAGAVKTVLLKMVASKPILLAKSAVPKNANSLEIKN